MARSRFQSGSLLIRGIGKKMYVARYYEPVIGPDGTLRRMRRSVLLGPVAEVGTRREAQKRLAELLRPINLGRQKPRAMLTLGEFVEQQWEPKALGLFKLSTRVGYLPLLKRHLLPYFGNRPLSEITPSLVQGFLTEKAKSGISWHTVRNLRNLLRSILRTAVEWDYVEENAAVRVRLPQKPVGATSKFLAPEHVRQLLGQLREPYRSMAAAAVLTGLRRSELFALRWGAVDFEKCVLEVRESVYLGHFSTPKTRSSARRIPLSSPLVAVLMIQRSRALHANPEDLVFASRRGTPLRPDNILKRVIRPACERAGLPRVGWHAFRHTQATILSELGEALKTAQAILGHADLETTLQHYTHAVPESVSRAEERLARAVMDPNGPKLDAGRKTDSEEGVWIQ